MKISFRCFDVKEKTARGWELTKRLHKGFEDGRPEPIRSLDEAYRRYDAKKGKFKFVPRYDRS